MRNVVQGLAFDKQIRFYVADTRDLVTEMSSRLEVSPVVVSALGQVASISGIMGLMLKDDQELTVIFDGDGPCGKITCVADSFGKVRGTVSNLDVADMVVDGRLDVAGAVGKNGTLSVIKNLKMREPFTSQINLASGNVAQEFSYYFAVSEQVATAIMSGTKIDVDHSIKSSGALIVQVLPGADEDVIDRLEKAVLGLGDLSSFMQENTLENVLEFLFEDDFEVLDSRDLVFECNCSMERYVDALRLLSVDEKNELAKLAEVECVCSFCRSKYYVEMNDIWTDK